jgi:dTDP-4-dehydrorhamnose reductase
VGTGPHLCCDLTDADQTRAAIASVRPEVVLHAQALSDVDRCEREPEAARRQNVTTTQHLVQALAASGALLVAVSTDYVFDGAKGAPYHEMDPPRPLSVYGRSKLEGEQAALTHPRALVVRTGTLFGPGRRNFCDDTVERLRAGEPVEAFSDQVTSPSFTADVAEGIAALSVAVRAAAGDRLGVYHVVNAGAVSRVAFAERIAQWLGCPTALIHRVVMAEQRRPARRPACSALATERFTRMTSTTLRPWDEALRAYLLLRRWLS